MYGRDFKDHKKTGRDLKDHKKTGRDFKNYKKTGRKEETLDALDDEMTLILNTL